MKCRWLICVRTISIYQVVLIPRPVEHAGVVKSSISQREQVRSVREKYNFSIVCLWDYTVLWQTCQSYQAEKTYATFFSNRLTGNLKVCLPPYIHSVNQIFATADKKMLMFIHNRDTWTDTNERLLLKHHFKNIDKMF